MAQTQYGISGTGAGTEHILGVYQTGAAAALPTETIYTAPYPCKVNTVNAIWDTVAGATSTVGIYKDTGTTAMGAGTIILAAAIDMTGTARTATQPALSATASDYTMATGDRLSVKVASGSATGSSGVNFTVDIIKT